MQGKIIRGIGGFYYVDTDLPGVVECKAKGIFRNKKVKPLVGDNVEVKILDREKMLGSIEKILPRKNSIIRPAVANVDQAVVIFSASVPKPNLNLLDRFLLMMQTQGIATVICFNKKDDADEKYLAELADNYRGCGSRIFMTSTFTGEGIKEFGECLKNKTSVLAGPSGVGKSSIINRLFPEAGMEIGEISEKIKEESTQQDILNFFHLVTEFILWTHRDLLLLDFQILKKRNSGIIIRNLRSIKIAVSFWDVFTYMSHSAV